MERRIRYFIGFTKGLLRKDYERLRSQEIDISPEIFTTQGKELSPPSGQIRFISWNIRRGYQYDQVLKVLRQLDFDILMLQESPITSKGVFSVNLAEEREDWSVFCPSIVNKGLWREDFSCFGQATLSQYPIRTHEVIALPIVHGWKEMTQGKASCVRYALYTQIDLEGKKLGVYNLHLENFTTPQGRYYQILPVLEHVERGSDDWLVIGGDFNTYLGKRERSIRVLKEAGFKCTPKDRKSFLDLDQFWSQGIPRANAKVLQAIIASDHKPLEIQTDLF